MRVLCISDEWDNAENPKPRFGYPYSVIHSERDETDGMLMYEMAEFPAQSDCYFTFEANAFVPLNGPDEKERLEEWQFSQLTAVDGMLHLCADMMPEVEMEPGAFDRIWDAVKQTL